MLHRIQHGAKQIAWHRILAVAAAWSNKVQCQDQAGRSQVMRACRNQHITAHRNVQHPKALYTSHLHFFVCLNGRKGLKCCLTTAVATPGEPCCSCLMVVCAAITVGFNWVSAPALSSTNLWPLSPLCCASAGSDPRWPTTCNSGSCVPKPAAVDPFQLLHLRCHGTTGWLQGIERASPRGCSKLEISCR